MQEAKIGDRVSLNVNKRCYFLQTEGGIVLNSDTETSAVIPKTATELHLAQINTALRNGHLAMGRIETVHEDPSEGVNFEDVVQMGRVKISNWVYELRMSKLSSALKVARLEKLASLEKSGKNRTSVLKSIDDALNYICGISRVIESDQEKVEIKLTPPEEVTEITEKTVEINRG